jgi:hypothetical protein
MPIGPLLFVAAMDRHVARVLVRQAETKKLVRETLPRRAPLRKRVGVANRFCQLIDCTSGSR